MTDFQNSILQYCNYILDFRTFLRYTKDAEIEYQRRWVSTSEIQGILERRTNVFHSFRKIREACDKMVASGLLDKNPRHEGYASYSPKVRAGVETNKHHFSRPVLKKKLSMPEYPKPLKREPKPKTAIKRTAIKPKPYTFKPSKPIRKVSAKRASFEVDKNKAYKVVTKTYCQGCGTSQFLSRSHTLPVSRNLSVIGDTRNIWTLCMDTCHLHCESSKFYLLECGQEMVQNMLEIDYLAGLARIAKMKDRINEAGYDVSGMPDWVEETLKLLE